MPSILETLRSRVSEAIRKAFGGAAGDADPLVSPATDPKFGHYQCNAAMGLAKKLCQKPRDIAAQIVEALEVGEMCREPEIAGPGFINLTLKTEYLTDRLRLVLHDDRLGVEQADSPQRIVIDYPSPNLAKEMHVGHLRTAIIGESLARTLEFLGHTVLRRDHLGDWGTQYGMLVSHLEDAFPQALEPGADFDLGDINEFYKQAKKRFDEDDEFKIRSREKVVALQSDQPDAMRGRQTLCGHSRKHCQEIYARLGVTSDEFPESFYKPFIPDTMSELDAKGMLVESDGAKVIFSEEVKNKNGDPLPLIVQKSDGGFSYDTTDLTTIRYRVQEEKADRILYVTDAGQGTHFAMIFAAAKHAGWLRDTEPVHVPFGLVLGDDHKKFKTRSGDTVRLKDLLDEAEIRARSIVDEKNPELSDERRAETARVIGIGSVKYADLSQNRMSDYVFSFDKMLALTGNTAPYLIYAYVRVQSIARKGGIDYSHLESDALATLETAEEIELGRALSRLPEALQCIDDDLLPNRLTDYLYDLAQIYSRFYTNNRVLGDERETTRLALCDLTARTLKLGLNLLGIDVIEEM